MLTTQGLNAEKSKEVLQNAGLIASENAIQAELLESTLIKAGLNKEEREAILNKLGLIQGEGAEAVVQGTCTKADLEAVLAQKLKNAEDAEGIIKALGLAGANTTTTASFGLLTKSIWANIKAMAAWMVSNPIGWIIMAGVAIVGTTKAIINHNEALEESRQEMIETGKEATQLTKDLDGLIEQYRKLGEDGAFDNSDREQAKNIQQQINELLGESVGYIDLANGSYEEQLGLLKKLQLQKANETYADKKEAKQAAEDSLLSKVGVEILELNGGGFTNQSEMDAYEKFLKGNGFSKYIKETDVGDIVFQAEIDGAEDAIEVYDDLVKIKTILSTKYEDEIEKGGELAGFYEEVCEKVKDWSEAVQKYKDALGDYELNKAVIEFNETDFGGVKGALIENEEQLKSWINAMLDSNDVSDGVKENLIGLANVHLPQYSDAIKETIQSHVELKAKSLDSQNVLDGEVGELYKLGVQSGLTNKEIVDLISTQIIFNNTSLNITGKVQALAELATQLGVTTSAAIGLNNALAGNTDPTGRSQMYNTAQAYGVKWDVKGWSYNGTVYKSMGAAIQAAMAAEARGWVGGNVNGDTPPYSPTNDNKSKDNKPDYEDPTDAIINRINLRAKELEQQEESIQNAIEIAELEKDYKKQISLTNDLIATRKQRIDELNKANAGLHNEAQAIRNANPWDEESWFDSQGNATEAYYNLYNSSSKAEQEKIKNVFENISKIKKAYMDNVEEIADTNKEILQDEEKIWDLRREEFDARMEESEYYIQHSKDFGWENGDNEIAARKRVLEWIQSDYYKSLIKEDKDYYEILNENRIKYNDALKEEFNKGTDFASSFYDSNKTLLQSYFDATNSIAEAQHEINKELEASKTMYEYLDEETRKLLFNQEDYNALSKELIDIQSEADRLKRQYEYDLNNSTLDTIEEITSNYEMQYEMLMKSYEIAKADLEIAKKKAKLNNVLNERNVRMFINGQWQWVANTQEVINAQSELADAEWAKKVADAGLNQTEAMNELSEKTNHLTTTINKFESGVITLGDALQEVYEIFAYQLPYYVKESFSTINDPASKRNLSIGASSYNSKTGETLVRLNESQFLIKKDSYASGAKKTKPGLADINEILPEGLMTNDGRFIPMANLSGGEMIFNHKMMENLWRQSQVPWNAFTPSFPSLVDRTQTIDKHQDNRIIINGMTVDSGSADGQALISALRRYVGNH